MPDTPEGRITLAVLDAKLDQVIALQTKMNGQVAQHSRDLAHLDTCVAVNDGRWESHGKEHESEAKNLKVYSTVISSVEAIVAMLVGVFAKPNA